MSFLDNPNTIRLLQDLLKDPDAESSDSEDEHLPGTGIHKFGRSEAKMF